jgi:hypothetical protein
VARCVGFDARRPRRSTEDSEAGGFEASKSGKCGRRPPPEASRVEVKRGEGTSHRRGCSQFGCPQISCDPFVVTGPALRSKRLHCKGRAVRTASSDRRPVPSSGARRECRGSNLAPFRADFPPAALPMGRSRLAGRSFSDRRVTGYIRSATRPSSRLPLRKNPSARAIDGALGSFQAARNQLRRIRSGGRSAELVFAVSDEFQPELAADSHSSALKSAQCNTRIGGIEQTVECSTAGLHADGRRPCGPGKVDIVSAGGPRGSPRVDVVFCFWQCDKENHGWCEGPPVTVLCQRFRSAGWGFTLRLNQFRTKKEYRFALAAASPPIKRLAGLDPLYVQHRQVSDTSAAPPGRRCPWIR